jgi:hypothetical protein
MTGMSLSSARGVGRFLVDTISAGEACEMAASASVISVPEGDFGGESCWSEAVELA